MKAWGKRLILTILWQSVRRRVATEHPVVLAVTGSVGKTTTKEALAAIIQETGRPFAKTEGNMNSESGVPLSLLGYKEQVRGLPGWAKAVFRALMVGSKPASRKKSPYYLLEYSADKPGDIAYLAKRLAPNVAILTRITPVHMMNYPDFAALVKEKFSLVRLLAPGGVAVLNADDPEQVKEATDVPRVWWYGIQANSRGRIGVWASGLTLGATGLCCTITFITSHQRDSISRRSSRQQRVQLHIIGEQQLFSLLAAATAALSQNIPAEQIVAALEKYQVPAGRGRVLEGKKGITLIDDSYNASPEAVKAGLDMLRPFAGKRRVVAILGTMGELGTVADQAHHEVAEYATNKADYLVFVGAYSSKMKQAAEAKGIKPDHCIAFTKPEHLFPKLDQLVKKDDVVYIKASQNGMRLERAVEKLLAHPEQAARLLTRQSNYWKQRV